MQFNLLPLNELIRIASASGGFHTSTAALHVNDLVQIASAASTRGAPAFLHDTSALELNDLLRIAAAGQGSTVFADQ